MDGQGECCVSRIRTIKPEFWTSDQVMTLSRDARLCFIGLLNFCDDRGVHPASPRTLKAEIFPSDDLTAEMVGGLVSEMIGQGLVGAFEADGKTYWFVTGWARHQKIDRPTFKHPAPPDSTMDHRAIAEGSPSVRRTIAEGSTTEGKGDEGKVENLSNTEVLLVASPGDDKAGKAAKKAAPPCPHQAIIDLYHEALPTCPRIRDWTPGRAALLRARWTEAPARQNLDYWRRLFAYVGESDFLMGRASSPGKRPFTASLEWLLKAENFAKVREGRYHQEAGE